MKRDLNFFNVYKKGIANTGTGMRIPLTLILFFILIIVVTYTSLLFIESKMTKQIDEITKTLADPEVAEKQAELTLSARKNSLMNLYLGVLTEAKANFDRSRVIDSGILSAIASSMPEDVVVETLIVNPQRVTLSCSCAQGISPAIFMQALQKRELFSKITYNGIAKNEDNRYFFNITCVFKEK